ncbi:hypothetical protein [Methylocapsa sp. S129]|uniref:hypothetical protein n=1 Tax=Methylocapsa sp. S129 TaxID=1641869 RepID=UPI00131C75E1|nr:hypothetical protein [Methylocapsa sp. S129]
MARPSRSFIICASAFVIAATLAASAQAQDRYQAHRGGDVVVHTGRSYLDPGASAPVGSENHYFSDSTHYSQEGPDFTQNTAGSELLPGRFGPN